MRLSSISYLPLILAASFPINVFGANSQTLEELVVYSTLDESSLSELAASISIWGQDEISNRNAQHLDQLALTVPNLNFSGGASRGRFAQIRGIGDIEQFVDPKAYPSVGLMLDGIEINGLFGAGLLFDAEQVEILRGPQGTRFGASALAGAINIVSPSSEQEGGFVEAGIGKFDSRQFGAAYGGKLSDDVSARVSVNQYRSDGYIENEFLNRDDTGGFDEFIARSKFDISISDDHSLDLVLLHIDNDNGYDAFSLDNTSNTTVSDQPGKDQQRVSAASIVNSMSLGKDFTLSAKLNALFANTKYSFDEDWINSDFCGADATCIANAFSSFDQYKRDRDEYTLDLKISTSAITAGLYAQKRDMALTRMYTFFVNDFKSDYEIERIAAYSQANIEINDGLSGSAGLRYEKFEDQYRDGVQRTKSDDDLWSFEASITKDLRSGNSLYGLVSRGEKPGGVNTDATSNFSIATAPAQAELSNRLRYKSESLTNLEVGLVSTYPEKNFSFRTTFFYNKRNNPQFETFLLDFPPPSGFLFIGYLNNANEAESHGVEWQGDWQPFEQLELQASVAYTDGKIRDLRVYNFDTFDYETIESKDQPRSASYQWYVSGNYRLSEALSLTLQYEGRDDFEYAYYFSARSENLNLLHANIDYKKGGYEISVWARNLLDEEYSVQGLYFANDPRDAFANNNLYKQSGEPRNIGIKVRYNLTGF